MVMNAYCECEEPNLDADEICTNANCNRPSFHSQKLWRAAEAQEALQMERSVQPAETEEQLANRLMREALPQAAMSLCHIASHSPNERLRLDASKYIIERNLGKLGDVGTNGVDDPFLALLGDVSKMEQEASHGSK